MLCGDNFTKIHFCSGFEKLLSYFDTSHQQMPLINLAFTIEKLTLTWHLFFHLKGSYPEVLEQATNSIACTEDHNMLRQLFNIVPSEVRVVTSPPKSCRQAESNCEYCMEQETQNSEGCKLFIKCFQKYTRKKCKIISRRVRAKGWN